MRGGERIWYVRAGVLAMATLLGGLLLGGCARSTPGAVSASAPAPSHTASAPARAVQTVVKVFTPFGPDGAAAAGVASRRSGSCFTTSITVPTASAYRCFAGNEILDPCFAHAAASRTLTCYAAPWSRATELRLTHALPSAHPLHITRPWAIELAGGTRCVAVTGTTQQFDGVVLGYQCAGGTAGLRPATGPAVQAVYRTADAAVAEVTVTIEWQA
jgi:hypothetical protein